MPRHSPLLRRRPSQYLLFGPGGQPAIAPAVGEINNVGQIVDGSLSDYPDGQQPQEAQQPYISTPVLSQTPVPSAATATLPPSFLSQAAQPLLNTPLSTQQQAVAPTPLVQASPTQAKVAVPAMSSRQPLQVQQTIVRVITSNGALIAQQSVQALETSTVLQSTSTIDPSSAQILPATMTTASSTTASQSETAAAASDSQSSSSSSFGIPAILGVVLACVVGVSVLAATFSWILRMRHKDGGGGFCGGCCGSRRRDDEAMEKWVHEETLKDHTSDLFAEKSMDGVPSRSQDYSGTWSTAPSSAGHYPVTPHPTALYAGGQNPFADPYQQPRMAPQASPYLGSPAPQGLADGPFLTPRPPAAHLSHTDSFAQLGSPHVGANVSPVQPCLSPNPLTVANLAPGDMSDTGSRPHSQPDQHSPWTQSSPAVPQPPRPWTMAFSPYTADERYSPQLDRSPRPDVYGTPAMEVVTRSVVLKNQGYPSTWEPLSVRSKSQSTKGTDSRKSSIRSTYTLDVVSRATSIAPRLPTPAAMSAANTTEDGWFSTSLKSNLYAALGAVAYMRSSTSHGSGVVPPSAPLVDRLTPTAPRILSRETTSRRKKQSISMKALDSIVEADPERPRSVQTSKSKSRASSHAMGNSSSQDSSASSTGHSSRSHSTLRSRGSGARSGGGNSRLLQNVQLVEDQDTKEIKRAAGPVAVAIAPTRSFSIYSFQTGYTTDKGPEGEDHRTSDVLNMYSLPSTDAAAKTSR